MPKKAKEKKVEKIYIDLPVFPEFTGERVLRRIKINKEYGFECRLPVPKTVEEIASMYDVPADEVLAIAVKQISYARDTELAKTIKNDVDNGVDFNAIEDVSSYAGIFEGDLAKAPERKVSEKTAAKKEKMKIADKTKALMNKFNFSSIEELEAALENL